MHYHTDMARHTKPKPEPPLPTARLFLDDIEEIAGYVDDAHVEATAGTGYASQKFRIETKEYTYDDIAELAKERGTRRDIIVCRGAASLNITNGVATLFVPPTKIEERVALQQKVLAIFQRRPVPWWRTSATFQIVMTAVAAAFVALTELTAAIKLKDLTALQTTARLVLDIIGTLVLGVIFGLLLWQKRGGTVVILRHSNEPGPLLKHWRENWPKYLIGSALTLIADRGLPWLLQLLRSLTR
jgi:hypothetical protein